MAKYHYATRLMGLALAALGLAGPAIPAHGAATPPPAPLVGSLGDVSLIEISGATTFSPDQIRAELRQAMSYQLAAHPMAPRPAWLTALQRSIADGYRHGGFAQPDVQVALATDTALVRVTIKEGPRYRLGEYKVLGAKTLPTEELVRQVKPDGGAVKKKWDFLSPYLNSNNDLQPGDDSNSLKIGDPMPFDETFRQNAVEGVRVALSNLGYYAAKFEVQFVPRKDALLADYVINLIDEGPRSVIGGVKVEGLKKNNSETVLHWLGLSPGQEISGNLVPRLEQQLWESGRFQWYKVEVSPLPAAPGKVLVNLQVKENEFVPPVGDESPLVTDWLEFRRQLLTWCQATLNRGDDLVIDAQSGVVASLPPGVQFHLVLSSAGLFGRVQLSGQRLNFLVSNRGLGFQDATNQRTWFNPALEKDLNASISLLPDTDPNSEKHIAISAGAGLSGTQTLPFKLSLVVSPAAWLYLVMDPGDGLSLRHENGSFVVSLSGSSQVLRFDPAAQRLLLQTPDHPEIPDQVLIHQETNALAQARESMASNDAGNTNSFMPNRPAGSFIAAFSAELLDTGFRGKLPANLSPAQIHRAAVALQKLCSHESFAPLDQFLTALDKSSSQSETFSIPMPPGTTYAQSLSIYAGFLFLGADYLLPHDSWLWTIARESALVLNGTTPYTGAVLQHLMESNQGPLTYWCSAELLSRIQPALGVSFAQRGLQKLTEADFAEDYNIALEYHSPLHDSLVATATAWRDLSDSEVDDLLALVPPDAAQSLRRARQTLRDFPSRPVPDSLARILNDLWNTSLQARLRQSLEELTQTPLPTNSQPH